MQLNEIKTVEGSRHRRKIVGRGRGSGHGKTSCRGHKGQGARSGNNMPSLGFQGGQMRLIRRLPKVGFTNRNHIEHEVVNLNRIDLVFEANAIIDPQALKKANLLSSTRKAYKVLSRGEISKAFTVKTYAISKSAQEKIEKAGGKVEIITPSDLKEQQ